MINTICDISEITFETKECTKLMESIAQRGIAIPVQVNRTDTGYACVDGNRRLSACQILCEHDQKFRRIPIMILNDYSKAGSAFWGNTQNRH